MSVKDSVEGVLGTPEGNARPGLPPIDAMSSHSMSVDSETATDNEGGVATDEKLAPPPVELKPPPTINF